MYPTVSSEYVRIIWNTRHDSAGYKYICVSVPKWVWRRRMADDGKKIVRLIQHKGKVVLPSRRQSCLELRTSSRRTNSTPSPRRTTPSHLARPCLGRARVLSARLASSLRRLLACRRARQADDIVGCWAGHARALTRRRPSIRPRLAMVSRPRRALLTSCEGLVMNPEGLLVEEGLEVVSTCTRVAEPASNTNSSSSP